MRIDFHCHVFRKENTIENFAKFYSIFKGYGFYERILEKVKDFETIQSENVIDKALYHIKKANLDKVVLLPVSSQENILVRQWKEAAPDVFIPFFNPPEKSINEDEIKKIIKTAILEDGYKGFKIMLSFRNKYLNDEIFLPILELAQKYKILVLMHTGWPPPGTKRAVMKYSSPLYLDEYLNMFPKVKFIIAHMGFPFSDIAITLATQYPNVYMDISNLTYMAPFRLKELLLQAKDIIGVQKILFGSDGFTPEMIEIAVDYFNHVDFLEPAEIDAIMGLNALKLLNL